MRTKKALTESRRNFCNLLVSIVIGGNQILVTYQFSSMIETLIIKKDIASETYEATTIPQNFKLPFRDIS